MLFSSNLFYLVFSATGWSCAGWSGSGGKAAGNIAAEIEREHTALLRPYYTAKRTREILISNIHLLSPQKQSQFVHFDIEKVFPRGQP